MTRELLQLSTVSMANMPPSLENVTVGVIHSPMEDAMESITQLAAKFEAAATTDATVAIAGEAFEQIRQLANDLAVPASDLFATWALVTVAACSGRDALGAPPAMPPAGTQLSPGQAGEDQTANVMASLATTLHAHLAQAATQATDEPRRRGLNRAVDAAAEIQDLLSAGGT